MKNNAKTEPLENRRALKKALNRLEEEGWTRLWREEFRAKVEEVGKWTNSVFKENQKLLEECRESSFFKDMVKRLEECQESDIISMRLFKQWRESTRPKKIFLLAYLEKLTKEAGKAGNYEKFLRMARLCHAFRADLIVSDFSLWLESAPEDLKSSAKELKDAFWLGIHYAFGKACEIVNDPDNLYLRTFYSILSKYTLKLKRWKPIQAQRQELLEEVRAIADDYYKQGGTKRHHEVARWFHTKPEYGDKFKKISLEKIRKVVGEVAELYGRKSGMKKTESP